MESNLSNSVEDTSNKIQKLIPKDVPKRLMKLPSGNYGPYCMKILHDFIEYHELPKDLPVPSQGLPTHEALSRIFDIMLHSMGQEKREELLKNLDEYNMGIPAHFRTQGT